MIIPFQPNHLKEIEAHDSQNMHSRQWDSDYCDALLKAGPCFTLIDDDKIICCCGLCHQWEERAIVWCIMSKYAGAYMLTITRATFNFLKLMNIRRLEAHVDPNVKEHQRWIRMLGFEFEGRMRAFAPDGRHFDLYARVQ